MKKLLLLLLLSLTVLVQCTPSMVDGPSNSSSSPNGDYLVGYDTHLKPDGSFRKKGYWDGDSLTGTSQIRISLDEQLAYFYKGEQLAGISPISTGMGGYETPVGDFKISQKSPDHTSSLYGVIVNKSTDELINPDADSRVDKPRAGEIFKGAPMPYFMRFNGAVGMHTGFTPGYPASHGCVRLPDHMAKTFFNNVKIGTRVVVGY